MAKTPVSRRSTARIHGQRMYLFDHVIEEHSSLTTDKGGVVVVVLFLLSFTRQSTARQKSQLVHRVLYIMVIVQWHIETCSRSDRRH